MGNSIGQSLPLEFNDERSQPYMKPRHYYHSPWRRCVYSFLLVASVMAIGTIGLHVLERMPYLDAFYFMSMIATAQGPISTPVTAAGKLFTAVMAFVSVGSVVATLGFLFGPFLGALWKVGHDRFEEELQELEKRERSRRGR